MAARHTILVVDDEPDVVQSVQDLLRLDYRVIGRTRAADALEVLRDDEVQVIMTDQRMPEITGVELLRRVRGEHPDAIRLLFTGYADIRAVIDAINQGNVFRYITKPWDPDELQTIIRQAVEQYDLLVERKRLLAELQAKNRQLEEANELKEAFIRVASHELRTPLTILYGLTQLASRSPELVEPVRTWITNTYKASERLNRLVDQLVKMLSAGRFERVLERHFVELAPLLQQASDDVRPFVEQRSQCLTVELAPDLGTLGIDAGKIRDSVDNLLLNAVKFTPDGGTIYLRARRMPDGIGISVTDTGVGIDAAHRQHLFETFFTGFDVSRHSSGQFEFGRKGLGLGLSLVKGFVELHGGRIEVASEPGKGSTFAIFLPQTEAVP
jgi:signal transduction histidine kinase